MKTCRIPLHLCDVCGNLIIIDEHNENVYEEEQERTHINSLLLFQKSAS